jgi:hypothetical protein
MKRIALAALLAVGCQASDDPEPLTGTLYVLESINGDALPATITPAAVQTPKIVYADTIALHTDGTGEQRTIRNGPTEGTKVVDRATLTWTRSGTVIIIRVVAECPFGADCFAPQYSGTEETGKYTITNASGAGVRVPLVYQRLFGPD